MCAGLIHGETFPPQRFYRLKSRNGKKKGGGNGAMVRAVLRSVKMLSRPALITPPAQKYQPPVTATGHKILTLPYNQQKDHLISRPLR